MDLLASSGSSVPVAVARKAVGTWAAWRRFRGVAEGPCAASVGTVGSGDQIRRSHHHGANRTGVVGERAERFWSGARGGEGECQW